jgi:hypothetical protein
MAQSFRTLIFDAKGTTFIPVHADLTVNRKLLPAEYFHGNVLLLLNSHRYF